MHDWVFVKLNFIWAEGNCLLEFKDSTSQIRTIKAINLRKLFVPRFEEWGPSVYVNDVTGHFSEGGFDTLKIEMQSGDQILVEASHIEMP